MPYQIEMDNGVIPIYWINFLCCEIVGNNNNSRWQEDAYDKFKEEYKGVRTSSSLIFETEEDALIFIIKFSY